MSDAGLFLYLSVLHLSVLVISILVMQNLNCAGIADEIFFTLMFGTMSVATWSEQITVGYLC